MQDVYTQVLTISTIAAVVTAAVALLMMNFSKNGKTVDESRAWLKRIIITWAILNALGFIMAYVTPFFAGGEYKSKRFSALIIRINILNYCDKCNRRQNGAE